jgi:hypothetical protein
MTVPTAGELGVNIIRLLDMIANRESCKACGRTIWMVRMKSTGKFNPITADGISHFADCPKSSEFRRKPPVSLLDDDRTS